MTNSISAVNQKKDPSPAFGVLLLLKALQTSLSQEDAIKGKILGNAIYISGHTHFPANLDLMGLDYFQRLNDEQKKKVSVELEKMKKPHYDLRVELQKFITSNWVVKQIFEKKAQSTGNTGRANNAGSQGKSGARSVHASARPPGIKTTAKPVAAPVVIIKKKLI